MPDLVAQMQAELADREVIRECIYRTARAIDRCDEQLFWSAYWPEAIHTGMGATLPIEKFIPLATTSLPSFDQVWHIIGNTLIKLRGTTATVESCFFNCQTYTDNGHKRDNIQGGRYLDRLERRDGEWRIVERTVVVDWFRDYMDSADWTKGSLGIMPVRGGRSPGDGSYALFASMS